MAEKKVPLRRCLACREMISKKQLLRIVKNADGRIYADVTGKANGRGAYLCKTDSCIAKCCKSKLLHKEFECAVPDEVYRSLKESVLAPKD